MKAGVGSEMKNGMKSSNNRALCLTLLVSMPFVAGCATYITRNNVHDRPGKFYPATRFNLNMIGECTGDEGKSDPMAPMSGMCLFIVPPMVIDLPFSMVVDTLLLPVDAFWKDPREQ